MKNESGSESVNQFAVTDSALRPAPGKLSALGASILTRERSPDLKTPPTLL
jgi:hypothetical protein